MPFPAVRYQESNIMIMIVIIIVGDGDNHDKMIRDKGDICNGGDDNYDDSDQHDNW